MRKVINGKMVIILCLLGWVLIARTLSGCSAGRDNQNKVRDLEFTVTGEAEEPDELKKIIAEKRETPFKLTYSNDQGLYIVVGYGKQKSGGYSIAVNDLYLTENSIVIDTELIGPDKGTPIGEEPSYPYIVVRTEYLENPIVFQ